jgi:UDP-N-acetylglucosamine 2-epimerase
MWSPAVVCAHPGSRANLAREHLGGQILVTGNTVIDALQQTVQRLDADPALRARADEPFHMLDPGRRLLLVTGHRRESFGQGFEDICRALAELARRPDLQVLYPVHSTRTCRARSMPTSARSTTCTWCRRRITCASCA